ncbi:Methionine synthase [Geodia barretti]|nr:Methionine synthase [Geodia barretti]
MIYVAKEMERNNMKIPLLIGGATTSKIHTAVKIAPKYNQPTVHVLDASKSVVVVSTLLDNRLRDIFVDDIKEEYEDVRQDYNESMQEKHYISLQSARANALSLDWKDFIPAKPKKVGITVFRDYDIKSLLPYIDWKPFFDVWQLRGKYPNRGYPGIFKDKDVGFEAKKVFDEAIHVLDTICQDKPVKAHGVIGLFPAYSLGDDVVVLNDMKTERIATLYGLRQQEEKERGDYLLLPFRLCLPKSH